MPGCEPVRVWSRLELRTRQVELDRVLQARTADPLWMLTRQWQFGEFQGEDTGSAVLATLARRTGTVTGLDIDGTPRPYRPELPLDAQVEQLPPHFPPAARAHAGRCFLDLLAGHLTADGLPSATAAAARVLAGLFPIEAPALDPQAPGQTVRVARRLAVSAAQRVAQALAGRSFDGVALAVAGVTPAALRPTVPSGAEAALDRAVRDHAAWWRGLFLDPGTAGEAWDDARLGYDFGATVSHGDGERIRLRGGDGEPGWHAFDVEATGTGAPGGTGTDVTSTLPSPAQFAGMPSSRWWQLEDSAVSLGRIRADAGDLTKLLATEFALLYGNDWLIIGDTQAAGTMVEVEAVVITDTFGRRSIVRSASDSAGTDWSRWDLFSVAPARERGAGALAQHLWTPPVAPPPLDGPVREETVLLRDEGSNTVWAVESRVPDGLGGGTDGARVARHVRATLDELAGRAAAPAGPDDPGVRWRYRLGTTVPENWIPFVPVHVPGGNREVMLQRASMPRFFPPGSPRVRPITGILRPGLAEDDEQHAPYYINEEEVSRAGLVIRGGMRRARWLDGRTVVWHARRRATGRGEGDSGLAFDRVEPVGDG
ncbi:hypothetical protein Asp14428_21280 [Actinoplanes sp. NBRC 14428]|nr:hypothetical protein Asp14428_21280 [Actinoplanes sp. NBRC 14428]